MARSAPRRARTIAVACALCAAGALAALALGLAWGADGPEGWRLAARYTARLAFLLFLPVYVASAWHRLAPSPASRFVVERRRALGLGFATAHTIHLGALAAYNAVAGTRPDPATAVVGGAAFAAMFAMVATSNDAAVRRLGRRWRTLHRAGLHLLWFVFAFSYGSRLGSEPLFFAPFAALASGGLAVRLIAGSSRPRARTPLTPQAARAARSSASR
jgi:sulfoxide reductase heme-binding subunit YedZ